MQRYPSVAAATRKEQGRKTAKGAARPVPLAPDRSCAIFATVVFAAVATPQEPSYGAAVNLDTAKKLSASAMIEAKSVAVLRFTGAMAIEGGLPIAVAGKFIRAIGVSGVTPQQDARVARAGIDALN